ncbi:MAG: hypothetical protein Q4A67_02470 [Aerococcus sp.]|nr:hypothetical protein [Aerococcus sp.]
MTKPAFKAKLKQIGAKANAIANRHPYLAIITILIFANAIGMAIQYQMQGFLDFSRFSTTLVILILALVAVAAKKRLDRKNK